MLFNDASQRFLSSRNSRETNSAADSQQSTEDESESGNSFSQLPANKLIRDVEVTDSTSGLHSNDKEECSKASVGEHQEVLQECEKQIEEQIHINVITSIDDKKKAEVITNLDEFSKYKKELTNIIKNLSVITACPAKQRPRQTFMNQPPNQPENQSRSHQPAPRLPAPPSYYSPPVPRRPEPPNQQPQQPSSTREQPGPTAGDIQRPQRPGIPIFIDSIPMYSMHPTFFIPTALHSTVIWAQLPSKIPPNIPNCLAHLVVTDSFYVIQLSLFDYFSDLNEFFLIQNKNGECLYFVYETMDYGEIALCDSYRAYRLHVMDMYQNEVIFMNRLSGCTSCCCCCYPEIQVYAPPGIPVGVITKTFNFGREEYAILDPDRNKMFKMIGPCCATCCCWSMDADFTIHAMDENETEVGFVRKEVGYLRPYISSELLGMTLPMDMDVRIKAVFLGAVFLTVR